MQNLIRSEPLYAPKLIHIPCSVDLIDRKIEVGDHLRLAVHVQYLNLLDLDIADLLPVLFAVCARVDILTEEGKQDNICVNSYKEAAEAGDDMLITAVIVPEKIKVASKRYSNTAQSHAVLTMSAAVTDKGFTLAAAVKNCGIFRFRTFEDIVRKNPDITEADALAFFKDADGLKISDDMFGSEEYKRYLLGVTAYDFCRKLAEDTGKEG